MYLDSAAVKDMKMCAADHNCVIKIASSGASPHCSRFLRHHKTEPVMTVTVNGRDIVLSTGDIVDSSADVIVVPTTPELRLVGGVGRAVLGKGKFFYILYPKVYVSLAFGL